MRRPAYGALRLGRSGKVALVDLADWFRLSRYTWQVTKDGHAYRVRTIGGRRRRQQLTHDVLGLSRFQRASFVNGNALDCRRANLSVTLGNIARQRRSRRNPYLISIRVAGGQYYVGGWPSLRWAEEVRQTVAQVAAQLRGRGLTRKQVQRQLDLAVGRRVRAGPVRVQQECARAA